MRSIVNVAGFICLIVPLSAPSAVAQTVGHSRSCGHCQRSIMSATSAGDCSLGGSYGSSGRAFGGYASSGSGAWSRSVAWDQLASISYSVSAYPTLVNPGPLVIQNSQAST